MNIFGPGWEGHPEAFFAGWRSVVNPDDLVIVPGDISWGLRLEEAIPDLEDLFALPGKKILLRGNHDYWWPSLSKLQKLLPEGVYVLQNNAVVIEGVAVVGTRGWLVPGERGFNEEEARIYQREAARLELSLKDLAGQKFEHLILAFHYPPVGPSREANLFTAAIERVTPEVVVYGHLHGADSGRLVAEWHGIPLKLVAADYLKFNPLRVL